MNRMLICLALGLALIGSAEAQKRTKYSVTVSVAGSGTVTSSTGGISCPGACTTNVNAGTAIALTASPDSGATFVGWGDACAVSETAVTCSLTVNGNITVSAAFEGGGGGGPTIEDLQARIVALEALLAGLSRVADPTTGAITLRITGMNVQVVNGLGETHSQNGAGNIILGYNEDDVGNDERYDPWIRTGSHNLIVGRNNEYTSTGGIANGYGNRLYSRDSAIFGGQNNSTYGRYAFIAGGGNNVITGDGAGIFGGGNNLANGQSSSILGGDGLYTPNEQIYEVAIGPRIVP